MKNKKTLWGATLMCKPYRVDESMALPQLFTFNMYIKSALNR